MQLVSIILGILLAIAITAIIVLAAHSNKVRTALQNRLDSLSGEKAANEAALLADKAALEAKLAAQEETAKQLQAQRESAA